MSSRPNEIKIDLSLTLTLTPEEFDAMISYAQHGTKWHDDNCAYCRGVRLTFQRIGQQVAAPLVKQYLDRSGSDGN